MRLYIALWVLTFLIVNCTGKDSNQSGQMDHTAHAKMEMEAGEPADASIYHVNSDWKNRKGRSLKLNALRGKVQIVAMVYTH